MLNLYDLRGVERIYGSGDARVAALDGVDLTVAAGEFLVIAGPSGSGKSTLLQMLGGLDRPSGGEVLFEGKDLATMRDHRLTELRRTTFGFIFQQFNLIPTLTAAQNVEAALAPAGVVRGHARRERAHKLLGRVGLGDRLDHLPTQLSGGEQQRVAIARALANDPRVILADEPTGNLDTATGREVLAALQKLHAAGQTIVLITHDPSIADSAQRLIRIRDGRLEDATVEVPA